MAIERIVIEVSGDPTKLKSTLDTLSQIGAIDEKNRKSFENTAKIHNKALKEEEDGVVHLGEQFKELGQRIIAALAVEKIIEFGAECIKAFEDAERASKRLEFAINNINGGGAGGFKELNEQSEALSESLNSLFSPTQIKKAQTVLAQAKISTEQILKLMPLIADISAKTGDSLDTVATKFVNATEIGGKGLKEYGGKFADLGDKTKNLERAMDELKGFTGGAQDSLNDFASKAQIAANKSEILSEAIGSKLAPAWEGLKLEILGSIDAVIDYVTQVNQLEEVYKKADNSFGASLKNQSTEQLKASQEYYDKLQNQYEATVQKRMAFAKQNIDSHLNDPQYEYSDEQKNVDIQAAKSAENRYDLISKEIAAREALKDATEKASVDEAEAEKGLTKLTDEELQKRLDDTKNNKAQLYYEGNTWNDKGLQQFEAAINKEIAKRKTANDKIIEMQKQFEATLIAIREAVANEEGKAYIDTIKDKYEKANAVENDQFRQRLAAIESQRRKLNEVLLKGTEEQQAEARLLLHQADIEQEMDEKAHQMRMLNIQREAQNEALDQVKEYKIAELNFDNDYEAAIEKTAEIDLKKKLDKKQITQKQYDESVAKNQIEAAKNRTARILEEDALEQQRLEQKFRDQQANGEDVKKTIEELDAVRRKTELDRINGANAVADAENKLTEATMLSAEKQKKALEEILGVVEKIADSVEETINKNIDSIDALSARQASAVETQRVLAQQGLANTLAFEERRADELEKRRLEEERKAKKAAELKVFLTSLEKFAEDNPNTALAKALGLLAATKVAEAVFAEDGALIGDTSNKRVRLGTAKHRSGNDVLIQAERGERILSVEQTRKFEELGGLGLLKKPIFERAIPNAIQVNNSELIEEVRGLRAAYENRPVYDMTAIPETLEVVVTEMAKGVKNQVRHEIRKPKNW